MHLAHLLRSLFQDKLWRGQANNGRVHDSSILKTTVGYRFHEGSTWTRVSYAHTELTNTSCLHSTQRGHIAFGTLPQLLQDHVTRAAIAWQRDLRTPHKNVTPTFYKNIAVYEGLVINSQWTWPQAGRHMQQTAWSPVWPAWMQHGWEQRADERSHPLWVWLTALGYVSFAHLGRMSFAAAGLRFTETDKRDNR